MRKFLFLLVAACGTVEPYFERDAGAPDSGPGALPGLGVHVRFVGGEARMPPDPADASMDAGEPVQDAGTAPDAGAEPLDAGEPVDAGQAPPDAGSDAGAPLSADSGTPDAGCTPGDPGCTCAAGHCAPGSDLSNPYVCEAQVDRCVNCGYPGGPCCDDGSGTVAGHTCFGDGAQCLHHEAQVWQCHSGYACTYDSSFYLTKPCFEGGCCGGLTCGGGGTCGP